MNKARKLLHKVSSVKIFEPFKQIFETIDGIVFGTRQVTSEPPHFTQHLEIKRYMSFAIIALLPSTISSIYFFGWIAIRSIIVSYLVGGIVEVAFALIRKKDIEEGFLVTGLIFPLILPPEVHPLIVGMGAFFGVFFGKEVFGGTGRNIFNPALVGRLFITVAFPKQMGTVWKNPLIDTLTEATPLSVLKDNPETFEPLQNLLFGSSAGSMGEIFRIGIIAGGLFLIFTKVTNWRIPVLYIVSAALFSFLGNLFFPLKVAPVLFQLLSGGLLFGAFFMATDPVTSPFTNLGKIVFGACCGFLTIAIRSFSNNVEGVMYSIIFMNALTPIIDHLIISLKYREFKI